MTASTRRLCKCLLKVAIQHNAHAYAGQGYIAYEWQTSTSARVLLQLENERGVIYSESDVECDVITGMYRVWVDGVEAGNPEMN